MTSSPSSHSARMVTPSPPNAPAVIATSPGFVPDACAAPQRLGHDASRLGLTQLVGEPVLVLRDGVALERIDQPGEGHFLRVAEGEVGDAGVALMVLPWSVLNPVEDVGDVGDHLVGPPFVDLHLSLRRGRHRYRAVGGAAARLENMVDLSQR